jgi:hypothetical protein
MLEHVFSRTRVIARLRCGPLGPYLDELATSLHHQGYAPSSIQRYLHAGDRFGRWLQRQGDVLSEMDEGCLGATEHKTGLRKALDPKVPNHLPF